MAGNGNMKKTSNIVLRILGILLLILSAQNEKSPDFGLKIQKMTKISKIMEKSRFFR